MPRIKADYPVIYPEKNKCGREVCKCNECPGGEAHKKLVCPCHGPYYKLTKWIPAYRGRKGYYRKYYVGKTITKTKLIGLGFQKYVDSLEKKSEENLTKLFFSK